MRLRGVAQSMAERIMAKSVAVLLIGLIIGIGGMLTSCSFMRDLSKKTSQDTPPIVYPGVDDQKPAKPDAK